MYTKLFQSIVTSTIWTEDDKTRLVWITLLALSDQHGEVAGSIPGLARLASVSVEDCEKALEKLRSPDPYSRTTDYEGRRIEDIDGGWVLLNHAKYRKMASKADQKEKAAERQRRCRERKRNYVTQCHATVTQDRDIAEAEAEAEAEADTKTKPPKSPKGDERGFEEFWKAYPKKVGKEAARRAWNKSKPDLAVVKATLAWQVRSEQWIKDGGQFVPNPATWINQGRWDDVRPGTSQPMPISTPRPGGPPHDYDDLLNDESVVPYEVKMAYGGRGARWRNLPEEIRQAIKAESDRRAEMARNGSKIDADASEAPSECDHSGEDVTAPLRAIREQLAI